MKNVAQNKYRNIEGTRRVPALRFPEFSGAGVSSGRASRVRDAAAVGLEWEEKKLGEIGRVIGGGTPDTGDLSYWNGEIDWFTPTEIKQKYLDKSIRKITAHGLRKSSARKLPPGSLLLTTRATVGDVGIANKEVTTNQGFQSIVVKDGNSNEFLYYWILQNRKEFLRCANGSTFLEISGKEVEKIRSVVPGALEQKKIAGFFGAVDEWIGILREEKSALETYKRGVMQRLFASPPARGGVVSLRTEGVGDSARGKVRRMPEGVASLRVEGVGGLRFRDENGNDFQVWEEKKLEEVTGKGKYGMNSSAIAYDGQHKYIRITDIDEKSGSFIPSPLTSPNGELEEKYKLKRGDLLFVRTGASVGKTYLYNENDGNLYFAGFLIKFSIKKANPYFIYSQTLGSAYKKWTKMVSMRSGQPGINAEEYESWKVVLPCIEEQNKIANFLTALDEIITAKADEITNAEEWKNGLMQKMFV